MTWARVPTVPLATALAGGIAVAAWTPSWVAWIIWAVTLALGLALLALRWPLASLLCLLAAVAAAGVLRATPLPLPANHVGRLDLPLGVMVEGRLVDEPEALAGDRTRVLIEAERVGGQPRAGRIQLTLYGEPPPLTGGQRVQAVVRLDRPVGFRNPGSFDRAERLRREGVHVVGSVRADRVVLLDDPRPAWNVRVRRAAIDTIMRVLPPTSAALLAGLLLGDRSQLPPDVDERFRVAGVYHVLAVSGFNVGLVAGSVFALLGFAQVGRRPAAIVAGLAVVGFAFVVGPEPSVLRAVVMGVLVLGAVLLDREAAVVNSLALAALLVLAVRPQDLFDPGFQLSFAATLGIVAAPLPRGVLLGSLGVSVAAQLAVIPIALVHFNQFSTLAPLANLAVVPLAGAATVLGLLGVTLSCCTDAGAAALLDVTWPLLLALRGAVAITAAVPGALLRFPAPSWGAIAAYALALALALLWWRLRDQDQTRARTAGFAALFSIGVALALAVWPLVRPTDGLLRIAVLDVGQGDAIVVEAPNGETVVVDAGSGGATRTDTGERVVAPFLWNRGVMRLTAAVTTHADVDHAGGMPFLLRNFTVREQWTPEARPAEPRWIGSVRMEVLRTGPIAAPRGTRVRAANEEALVIRIDHGAVAVLLASDIGAAAESALLAARAPLAASVLKVAHHGSRGSSTPGFLAGVAPRVAVISVGARNRYGHPASQTLARLDAAGARVYRTDRDGAVLLETDGAALTVTRWATRQRDRYCLDPGGVC